jgi:hypothetical protein
MIEPESVVRMLGAGAVLLVLFAFVVLYDLSHDD